MSVNTFHTEHTSPPTTTDHHLPSTTHHHLLPNTYHLSPPVVCGDSGMCGDMETSDVG